MTGLKWKQKTNSDGDKLNDCWITECGYTVARCFIDKDAVYAVTAPRESKPVAYPKTKDDVLKVINMDKELRSDSN